MSKMSAQSLRMAIVNTALEDASFREALETNATAAITERFGENDLKLNVHFEKEGELPILIPARSERLEKALAQVVADIGDRPPTRGEFEAVIIHKAWSDESFLEKLQKDARAAIDESLSDYSASLPEEVSVRLYKEGAGECTVVIPIAVDMSELSEEELESVAGGEAVLITGAVVGAIVGSVVGAIASKVVDVIWEQAPEGPEEEKFAK